MTIAWLRRYTLVCPQLNNGALFLFEMAEESLKNKTVKGVAWSGIDNVAQFGVSFIVSLVLARLLTPDDYGLIGIITIFTAISTALVNSGFSTALIRKEDLTDEDYNTTFVVNLIISSLLYGVMFVCAPFIASFFGREELIALTRVASLGFIAGAFTIVQQTHLTIILNFKTQTKISIIASIISGTIGIVMALIGYGVWSLVFQGLSLQVIRSVLFWVCSKWRPRFLYSNNSFKGLFGFGWKIIVSNLLDTIWKELNQVVIGRFYNPATLGQYTRSDGFAKLFSSNLTNVIQRVTYPVLSSIQSDKQRMKDNYRRIIKQSMFLSVIPMIFLGAISEPLLYCLIGPQWHEAATYLPFICIVGSTYPLQSLNLNMLEVQGRSDLFLGIEIIKKMIALFPLYIGAVYGIMEMLIVTIITTIIAFFLNSHYSGKQIGYSSWMQIKDVAPSYGIATIVALSVYFIKYLPLSYWIVLPIQVIIGGLTFFIICKVLKNPEFEETILICRGLFSKITLLKKKA